MLIPADSRWSYMEFTVLISQLFHWILIFYNKYLREKNCLKPDPKFTMRERPPSFENSSSHFCPLKESTHFDFIIDWPPHPSWHSSPPTCSMFPPQGLCPGYSLRPGTLFPQIWAWVPYFSQVFNQMFSSQRDALWPPLWKIAPITLSHPLFFPQNIYHNSPCITHLLLYFFIFYLLLTISTSAEQNFCPFSSSHCCSPRFWNTEGAR